MFFQRAVVWCETAERQGDDSPPSRTGERRGLVLRIKQRQIVRYGFLPLKRNALFGAAEANLQKVFRELEW